jgi:vacuolar-type H+-ATPase subunit H
MKAFEELNLYHMEMLKQFPRKIQSNADKILEEANKVISAGRSEGKEWRELVLPNLQYAFELL